MCLLLTPVLCSCFVLLCCIVFALHIHTYRVFSPSTSFFVKGWWTLTTACCLSPVISSHPGPHCKVHLRSVNHNTYLTSAQNLQSQLNFETERRWKVLVGSRILKDAAQAHVGNHQEQPLRGCEGPGRRAGATRLKELPWRP